MVTDEPTLTLDSDLVETRGVRVDNLAPDLLAAVRNATHARGRLLALLRVKVVPTGRTDDEEFPDILGHCEVSDGGVRFVPHFPFDAGVRYRASFDGRTPGSSNRSEVLTLDFSLPQILSAPPTVKHVFPTGDVLPENLLRFYVSFSRPMQRGAVEDQISILGPDGQPTPDVLYRAPVELWDKRMQRLTVLLDPGRLKRGVGPNRELGPPLRAGHEYTFAIGSGMSDLVGQRLPETYVKRFRVTEAVRERIAVEHWQVDLPATNSHQSLVIMFPRPLDWTLLTHSISVSSCERVIEGAVAIDHCETRWSFAPTSAWARGHYQIHIADGLEDVCGNDVAAAFDRPLRPNIDLPAAMPNASLAFHLV